MMANEFYIAPPNILQALLAGQQGFDSARERSKQADITVARQAIAQGGDPKNILAQLVGAGDIQGANLYAGIQDRAASRAMQDRNFQAQRADSERDFGLRQQQLALSQRQADAAARGYEYKDVDDPNNPGSKIPIRIERATGKAERVPIGGVETQPPANPYAPTQKLTEGQAKDRAYLTRMIPSHKIITELEGINDEVGGTIGSIAAQNPYIRDSAAFNLMASKNRQKILQAQRDFVNAILRRESGAVINPSEFDNATRQYFPVAGDDPEVIAQKRQNRMLAIEGMMQGAGPGYRPPSDYIGTKGPPPGAPAQAAPAQPQQNKTKTGITWSVSP